MKTWRTGLSPEVLRAEARRRKIAREVADAEAERANTRDYRRALLWVALVMLAVAVAFLSK
jgi:hypothetical protein